MQYNKTGSSKDAYIHPRNNANLDTYIHPRNNANLSPSWFCKTSNTVSEQQI